MPDAPTIARPLRVVWGAVCASAALVLVVVGGFGASRAAPMPEAAEVAFYTAALLSVVATAGAFALQRAMETRLLRAGSEAEAEAALRTYGVASLAAAEVPALVAAVAAFLTGDAFVLALGATVFAFAWLTWPSDGRVGYWLSLRHR